MRLTDYYTNYSRRMFIAIVFGFGLLGITKVFAHLDFIDTTLGTEQVCEEILHEKQQREQYQLTARNDESDRKREDDRRKRQDDEDKRRDREYRETQKQKDSWKYGNGA